MYKLLIAKGGAMTLLAALMRGGYMQATLAPKPEAGWNARDRELMSNLPYKQAAIPEEFRRHIVDYSRKEAPGGQGGVGQQLAHGHERLLAA
jgi:hypothetical protein